MFSTKYRRRSIPTTVRQRFLWQEGHAAYTVSYSQFAMVRQYIQNQELHHRRKKFEDEYMELLRRHAIEFERQFLFEGEHYG